MSASRNGISGSVHDNDGLAKMLKQAIVNAIILTSAIIMGHDMNCSLTRICPRMSIYTLSVEGHEGVAVLAVTSNML